MIKLRIINWNISFVKRLYNNVHLLVENVLISVNLLDITNIFFVIVLFAIIIYVLVLISVAFFTLLERKCMGAIQRRIGPNSIGLNGLLQPIADGIKLALKETIITKNSNQILFLIGPLWSFFISLIGWAFIPLNSLGALSNPNIGLLLIMLLSSLNIYGLLIASWASNNKYALLGGIRSVSQMISYEVVFIFIVSPIIVFSGSLNLLEIADCTRFLLQKYPILYLGGLLPFSIMFLVFILAETNRAPFDLPEAEAELVAGFNVEYSSFIFALFFLSEYCNMLIMSSVYVILFLGSWGLPFILVNCWICQTIIFVTKVILVSFVYIWVRATLPRLRYDYLLYLVWKVMLPIAMSSLFLLPLYKVLVL